MQFTSNLDSELLSGMLPACYGGFLREKRNRREDRLVGQEQPRKTSFGWVQANFPMLKFRTLEGEKQAQAVRKSKELPREL